MPTINQLVRKSRKKLRKGKYACFERWASEAGRLYQGVYINA